MIAVFFPSQSLIFYNKCVLLIYLALLLIFIKFLFIFGNVPYYIGYCFLFFFVVLYELSQSHQTDINNVNFYINYQNS